MRQSNPLTIILEQHRLTGPNFVDWLRNLKVVLAYEKILFVLTQSPPEPLPADVSQEERDTLKNGIICVLLCSSIKVHICKREPTSPTRVVW